MRFLDDEGIYISDWFPWPKSSWVCIRRYVSCIWCRHRPSGAHWCPDPGLGGGPQDTIHQLIRGKPRCFRKHLQARGGHTHCWVTWWVALIKFSWIRLHFFTFLVGVILNTVLNEFGFHWLMFLVLFSTNDTKYISKYFKLEYFVQRDLMFD